MKSFTRLLALVALAAPVLAQAAPQYVITDLGVVGSGNTYSQAFGISTNGRAIVGRSIGQGTTEWPAFVWQADTGTVAQAALKDRAYAWGYGVNNAGVAVGLAALTESGGSPVPVLWSGGTVTKLAMPSGQTAGRAFDINNNGIAVGSVGGGASEVAVVYNTSTGTTTYIQAVSSAGSYMQTATSINDAGIITGNGVDSAGRNVAVSYNMSTGILSEVPLPVYTGGFNSSLASALSDNGWIGGSSGNRSQAFLWSQATGTINVPLPAISSNGGINGVNNMGWAVGSSGGVYSNPFLYADDTTYLISDIITNEAGWNFDTTTSASALGISNNGIIVGTAQINGIEHAYMLTPVPEPATYGLMMLGLIGVGFAARRRQAQAN